MPGQPCNQYDFSSSPEVKDVAVYAGELVEQVVLDPVCSEANPDSLVHEATFNIEVVERWTQAAQPRVTYDSVNGKLIYFFSA